MHGALTGKRWWASTARPTANDRSLPPLSGRRARADEGSSEAAAEMLPEWLPTDGTFGWADQHVHMTCLRESEAAYSSPTGVCDVNEELGYNSRPRFTRRQCRDNQASLTFVSYRDLK